MPSERVQRRINRLLDEAAEAVRPLVWEVVRERAQAVLDLDPENADARAFLRAAGRAIGLESGADSLSVGSELRSAQASGVVRSEASIHRRVFVGREVEMRHLERTFEGVLAGEGALAMVSGEPGIGKTALCEQLATYVAAQSGRAQTGHCYEAGSLSLPYLPFVEALHSYVLVRRPDQLRRELGSGAADVARIVPEVQERLAIQPRPAGDPEDDRWRLYQAVTSFLRCAATIESRDVCKFGGR